MSDDTVVIPNPEGDIPDNIEVPGPSPVVEVDWKTKFEALEKQVNIFSEAFRTHGAGAGSTVAAYALINFLGHVRTSEAPPTMDQASGQKV